MEQTKRSMPGAVALLAALGFVLGTCEFVIVGILPEIAEGLGTSLAAVGKLVSVFAACYAVGTPVITAATGGVSRKKLLAVLMGLFLLTNAVSLAAPNVTVLYATRVLAALVSGTLTAVAMLYAKEVTAPDQTARAISLVYGGFSVAAVLGVPLGTAVCQWLGWRWTFAVILLMALRMAATLALLALSRLALSLLDALLVRGLGRRLDSILLRCACGLLGSLCLLGLGATTAAGANILRRGSLVGSLDGSAPGALRRCGFGGRALCRRGSRLLLGEQSRSSCCSGALGLDVGLGLASAAMRAQGGIDLRKRSQQLRGHTLGQGSGSRSGLGGLALLARTGALRRLGSSGLRRRLGSGCGGLKQLERIFCSPTLLAGDLRLRHLGKRASLGNLGRDLMLARIRALRRRAAGAGAARGLFPIRRRSGSGIGRLRLRLARPARARGLRRRLVGRLVQRRGGRRLRTLLFGGLRCLGHRGRRLNRGDFVMIFSHYACSTTFFQSASKLARP